MAAKMQTAIDANGRTITVKDCENGEPATPLKCEHCSAPIHFVKGHTRQLGDEPSVVPPFFRLNAKQQHQAHCPFDVVGQVTTIVRESDPSIDGLFRKISARGFEMRLLAVKASFDAVTQLARVSTPQGQAPAGTAPDRQFIAAEKTLGAYINSAMRVLKVRAALEHDAEIEDALHLVFDNMRIPWDEFYFERQDYFAMHHRVSKATHAYPMAALGEIKTIKQVTTPKGTFSVLDLKSLTRPTEDPQIRDSVQISIWSNDLKCFSKYEKDQQILAFGLWKTQPSALSAAKEKAGPVRQFRNHKLSLWPVTRSQLHLD